MSILWPRFFPSDFPNLVQAQAAALTVGSVTIDNDESDLRGEGLQVVVGEQVNVPQPVAPVTPIQQIVTWFNIGFGQADIPPGENALRHARARGEVPG